MPETVLLLERTSGAPGQARQTVRGLQAGLGPRRAEDATLLVSELVTNAVKYGPERGEIRLIVDHGAKRARFTVHDLGAGPLPRMRPYDVEDGDDGGHGLRLVDRIADRWGVERGSTRVWFELDA